MYAIGSSGTTRVRNIGVDECRSPFTLWLHIVELKFSMSASTSSFRWRNEFRMVWCRTWQRSTHACGGAERLSPFKRPRFMPAWIRLSRVNTMRFEEPERSYDAATVISDAKQDIVPRADHATPTFDMWKHIKYPAFCNNPSHMDIFDNNLILGNHLSLSNQADIAFNCTKPKLQPLGIPEISEAVYKACQWFVIWAGAWWVFICEYLKR